MGEGAGLRADFAMGFNPALAHSVRKVSIIRTVFKAQANPLEAVLKLPVRRAPYRVPLNGLSPAP